MDYKKYNGSVMTSQQVDLYLDYIGMERPEALDLEYLTRLQMAHVSNVPFENLDILRKVPLSLKREHLFEKIVMNHRGGVCSEVNTLFNWLLESLGFEVVSFSSRIISEKIPVQAKSHRLMGVKLNGGMYITDVGKTAENHRIPLLLKEEVEQDDGECVYKFTKDDFFGWILWQKRPGLGWRRKLGFTEDSTIDLDFEEATRFAQYNEGSFFNKCPMVSLYIDGVFHALRGDCYLHEHNGIEELIYKIESKEQEAQVLKEIFGL